MPRQQPTETSKLVPAEQLGFKASPNPFNDLVRVAFVLPERQAYRLQLISATGQTIGEWKQTGEKGRQEIVLDHQLAGLPAGTYLLELSTKTTAAVLLLVR